MSNCERYAVGSSPWLWPMAWGRVSAAGVVQMLLMAKEEDETPALMDPGVELLHKWTPVRLTVAVCCAARVGSHPTNPRQDNATFMKWWISSGQPGMSRDRNICDACKGVCAVLLCYCIACGTR